MARKEVLISEEEEEESEEKDSSKKDDSFLGKGLIRPGLPTTKLLGGTSLVTSAPAAMKLRSPMLTPGKIMLPPPITTSSSITDPRVTCPRFMYQVL